MTQRLWKMQALWIFMASFFLTFGALAQTTVPEHWSPYDYPTVIPEGTSFHIIEDGDTLWDISARYLGDPLLWPSLFQANDYITDPDLIYPGDPILMDVGVAVTPETIAGDLDNQGESSDGSILDSSDSSGAEGGQFTDMTPLGDAGQDESDSSSDAFGDDGEEEFTDVSSITDLEGDFGEFVILPAGTRADMECSTYIYSSDTDRDPLPFDMVVSSGELDKNIERYSTGDVVFINKGTDSGVQSGDEYAIRRQLRPVYYPGYRGAFLGYAIDQIGILKIIAVQAENATGLLIQSCTDTMIGDFLVPYESEPIPLITELPNVPRWEEFSTDGSGMIVNSEDDLRAMGEGHRANIDLGIENNVAPGDLFLVYRSNPRNDEKKNISLPNIILGYAVALRTDAKTTVIKFFETFAEVRVGDMIVPLAFNDFGSDFDEGE